MTTVPFGYQAIHIQIRIIHHKEAMGRGFFGLFEFQTAAQRTSTQRSVQFLGKNKSRLACPLLSGLLWTSVGGPFQDLKCKILDRSSKCALDYIPKPFSFKINVQNTLRSFGLLCCQEIMHYGSYKRIKLPTHQMNK